MAFLTPSSQSDFEQLFRANARAILGYAIRRSESPDDAADVVSEVMLTAWRRLGDVPRGDPGRLWLLGTARNVLANQSRSKRRRDRLGERLRAELARIDVPDPADEREVREVVMEALRKLSADDREILLLSSWEDLEPTEIAAVVSIRPAAARTRLHRAKKRLRRELESMLDPELCSSQEIHPTVGGETR